VIRRNRIAIAVAGGMATVLALVMWSTNAVGVQGTNVAQTGSAVEAGAAPGDYGYDTPVAAGTEAPPVADAPVAEAPAAGAQTSAEQPPAAAPVSSIRLVAKTVDKMGDVVQDGDGRTLYRFDKDTPKPTPASNCNDKCAETWPPLVNPTPGATPQLEGVDPALVGTLKRADGSEQITLDGWALYTYSKDPGPGKWAGQGVGGTWWVIQPNGKRNVECLPPGVTAPAA
jgi:predicted lipoprotein with Yx(FWY)xxD motif